MREQLPPGWLRVSILDLAEINPRHPRVSPKDAAVVSFLPMAAVEAVSGRFSSAEERPWSSVKKGYTRFQDGDVLFAKITPCMENGKTAVVRHLRNGVGAGSTEFHVLRPKDGVDADLLRYYLLQESFRREARGAMTGTAGQLRVPTAFIEEHKIPISPVEEQQRITKALDSYFSRLEDVEAGLERVRRNLKRYRASVLQAAVTGRLVPTEAELARAEGRTYEPAAQLLDRILAERRRRWEESGKKGKYQEPAGPDTSGLPVLPEGWCWASIDQLATLVRNGYSKKPSERGDTQMLRISAVRPLSVDFTDIRWLPGPASLYESDLVRTGDLLFTRYNGSASLVGVAGLVRVVDRPTVHPDKLIKVRLTEGHLVLAFVELAVNAGESRRFIESRTRTTAGQAGVSGGDIKQTPIPLPPLTEQNRIALQFDEHFAIGLDCEKAARANLLRLGRLRQSVLRWAFEGKLADQCSTDEPAGRLLERIRSTASSRPGDASGRGSSRRRVP